MMADSIWVFCMALNVMLVFFRGYDSRQLRHLEKWYLIGSYGVPGLIALVYIILDHAGPKRIIGPATVSVAYLSARHISNLPRFGVGSLPM
jgi:hypothetical protein